MADSTSKIGSLDYYNQMIRTLARRANRRLERASEGQRSALEYYMRGYHTREKDGELFFRSGKAKTAAEARSRYNELQDFLSGASSKRSGWERMKKENVSKGAETANRMGYDISDEEFAQIVKETGGRGSAAFYRALENVTARKYEREMLDEDYYEEDDWEEELQEAIAERITDQEATERLLRARQQAEQQIKREAPQARSRQHRSGGKARRRRR